MNLFSEILLAFLVLLITTAILGLFALPLIRRLDVGQQVRVDGPKSHYKKNGTPTFGGLFFLLPLIIAAITIGLINPKLQILTALGFLILGFAVVGFLDDYYKVRVNNKGLSVRQKSLIMAVVSILFTIYYLYLAPQEPFILLPFSNSPIAVIGLYKIVYGVFVLLYLFFVTNAVNITDGVDGLAASVTAIAAAGLCGAGLYLANKMTVATMDSKIPLALHAADNARSAALLAAAVAGGCLSFLIFNRHPAKIFMGDTGSQALGAAVAGIALIVGAPWLIIFFGIIYLMEAFSVIIQVLYFKKTGGKRIFRMSPIHHHFELGGWKEEKIVRVFSLITVIGSTFGFLLLQG